MNFYFFAANFDHVKRLPSEYVSGVLFTYNIFLGDFFSGISRALSKEEKNMTYIVAIKPYVISPQYLCMINRAINNIAPNSLRLNFVTGDIKKAEEGYGGVLGNINDQSSNIDRSNYLIEYVDTLVKLNDEIPDYYVSVTNEHLFNSASKNKGRMIIPYRMYKKNKFNIDNEKVMVSITPKLRETKEEVDYLHSVSGEHESEKENFTYEEFSSILKEIESKGIDEVLIATWPDSEREIILEFIKKYKTSEKENK
jgi:hypothetical protein